MGSRPPCRSARPTRNVGRSWKKPGRAELVSQTLWHAALLLGAVVGGVGGAAGCDGPATGAARSALLSEELAIPGDVELAAQLADALAVKRRADLERAIDALEPGEQLSHATLSQIALDREVFTLADLFLAGDDLFGCRSP